jgi:formylglycine-generating enzyme required for sulfatase activity
MTSLMVLMLLVCTATAEPAARAEFVRVPAGTFRMGCPATEPGCMSYEQPQHEVAISRPFLMSATEVTQEQWLAVMASRPAYFRDCHGCPVERVSWYDAVAYCNALSRREGFEPAYAIAGTLVTWRQEAAGYRLPTEAEWEYACRAGSQTIFHTGDCLTTDQANIDGYGPLANCPDGMFRGQPVPGGSFPANAWGLYDLHGNVYEWCWDWNGFYAAEPATDPSGPAAGTGRVCRGGCWAANAQNCRSATRQRLEPATRLDYLGFRVVRWAP